MTDLLTELLAQGNPHPTTNTFDPAQLPLRTLVDWFVKDCKARNLQPRTIDFYKLKLSYLLDAIGNRHACDITTAHLRLLLSHFHETRHWSVGTANHTVTSWKVFFSYLAREDYLPTDPARRLQKMKGAHYLPEPYTPDEIHRLLHATGDGLCGARDTAIYLLLLDTGIRLNELMTLTLPDVDLALGQIRVFGKGRKERLVPFSSPVRRLLVQYLKLRHAIASPKEDAVWVTEQGEPFTTNGFKTQLRRHAKKANIPHAHAHRFRHTMATMYLQQGGHAAHLQRLLGHTTPIMTNRYVHLADVDARDDHLAASPVTNLLGSRYRGPKGK